MKWATKVFALAALVLPAIAAAADSPTDLLAAGRVDDAISSLSGKLNVSPNDAASHNLLCRAYFAVGKWDHAISECEKAISLEPNNGEYHLWLGRTYGEKADASNFLTAAGLAKKVRTEFERAVQLDPSNVSARTDLAEFYLEAPGIVGGGQDKARAQADMVAKLNPAKAHWIQGRLAEKNKDVANAEKEYRAAIDASHGGANAWLNLALFYRKAGRLDEMQDALKKAASAPMDQPEVLVDAASTLLRANRDLPFATQLVRRYLSSNITVEEAPPFKAHYLLGNILEKQGDKQGAAKEYQAALTMAKDFGRAREALNRVSQ